MQAQSHYSIFYVTNTADSAAFYTRLLGRPPVESSPGFALFALAPGVMLGLWARHTVQPPVPAGVAGVASELALALASADAVKTCHDDWQRSGVNIVQAPQQMDFGFTFVAADPDGHRVRVFAQA